MALAAKKALIGVIHVSDYHAMRTRYGSWNLAPVGLEFLT